MKELASPMKIDLKKAYRHAGIPSSSYYRNFESDPIVEITFHNAEKIAKQIKQLSKNAEKYGKSRGVKDEDR